MRNLRLYLCARACYGVAMRLIFLTILTLIAFAANSVLNRAALAVGGLDAMTLAVIRLGSGAFALAALCLILQKRIPFRDPLRIGGTIGLAVYILGFSLAHQTLDAGLGALILFGTVQLTMFIGALILREPVPMARWIGAALAFGGLAWLLWPTGEIAISLPHAALMVLGGAGWGIYSLVGRAVPEPIGASAANFVICAGLFVLLWIALPADSRNPVTQTGLVLGILSGAVTSGMGYALWYSILPRLGASIAAVAQLTVPLIAMAGGMVFLGEALTLRFVIASALVLGGIALSIFIPALATRSDESA